MYQARVRAVPDADAFSPRKPWVSPVCQHRVRPMREGRSSTLRPGSLSTGADTNPGALRVFCPTRCWGGCRALAPPPVHRQTTPLPLALIMAPLAPHACRASEAPSVTTPNQEGSYCLMFCLRRGVVSGVPELCSVEGALEMCPRADWVLYMMGS